MAFQKGVSGNPGGRPAEDPDVRKLARDHSREAIETLIGIMRNKRAAPSVRVTAATSILDRGFGRPGQDVSLAADLTVSTSGMSDLEMAQRLWAVLERAASTVQ